MSTLSRKHLRAELDDGRVLDVTTIVADQLAYETTRHRRKWPMITEGGVVTWWSFLAWAAASRLGEYAGKYEEWTAALVDVEDLDPDVEGEPVDPTPPDRSASSSSA